MTNRQAEEAAIAHVWDYERGQGRESRDRRNTGDAADLESSGRVIEVKALGNSSRGALWWLELRQFEKARHNPDLYLYVVEQVHCGAPTLKILDGEHLAKLLERPTGDYDATPVETLEIRRVQGVAPGDVT